MLDIETLPKYEMDSFALWVARATELYFKDPENQRRFKEWQKEERRKKRLAKEQNK